MESSAGLFRPDETDLGQDHQYFFREEAARSSSLRIPGVFGHVVHAGQHSIRREQRRFAMARISDGCELEPGKYGGWRAGRWDNGHQRGLRGLERRRIIQRQLRAGDIERQYQRYYGSSGRRQQHRF